MSRHLTFGLAVLLAATAATARAQDVPGGLDRHIGTLSDFDYSTRMNAARTLRRIAPAEAVPALVAAARGHDDEFVRYRALVLLTSFNDRGTADLMQGLLPDRNDRVREVAYRWFERYPNPALTTVLLASLETEQSEFVRPALVRAVAALPRSEPVQRALTAEIGRGFNFFRSAVIAALGEHRAVYALDAIAVVAAEDGPLQDDALLALGRMGDRRALATLSSIANPSPEAAAALQAAHCLLEEPCGSRIEWLVTTARHPSSRPEAIRAAVAALGVIAESTVEARTELLDLAGGASERLQDEAALALSGVALRRAADVIGWLVQLPESRRGLVVDLLRQGFESLEEDFAEEQFFAAARAAYWAADEGSPARSVAATLIDRLEF